MANGSNQKATLFNKGLRKRKTRIVVQRVTDDKYINHETMVKINMILCAN